MRERPVSVMIFGILNIGFGVIGLGGLLTQNAIGSFGSVATQSSIPSLQPIIGFLEELYKRPSYILWRDISVPLEGVASLILLVAGIGLWRMKNWARLASIGYALYEFIFFLANIIVLYLAVGDALQKAFQSVSAAEAVLLGGILLICAAVSLAYPALLLFFMTRPRIKAAFQPSLPPPTSTP